MRRRRLDVYRTSPAWPGKDIAILRGGPLTPEAWAALEDRLAVAGLDVLGDIPRPLGDVFDLH